MTDISRLPEPYQCNGCGAISENGTMLCDRCVTEHNELVAENERLQSFVDRLAKTADGVPITYGAIVWVWFDGIERAESRVVKYITKIKSIPHVYLEGDEIALPHELYSTCEAAEAAGGDE